ncbi:MAG: MFS transporter [Sphingomonas sp.]|uniref:MFS transporter n=1 Tax=Sphingomonas sp. TaxID=28214 RepID=UPI0025E9A89C|nr:MFS transporter [Sphingomonas sp.]MBX9881092.1 MFS transporter [Sphingomonas sp.]
MAGTNRAVSIVLAAVLIDTIGFGIVLPVLPQLIVRLSHLPLAEATRIGGYMLMAFAAAQFFAGPVIGNLGDRYGRRPVILACMLAFGLDYALMAFAPTLAWLFLGRVIAGVTGAVYGPANAVLADVTPPEQRGARFGLMGAMFGLGFILGPALGGLLAGLDPRAPFLAAAVIALLNAVGIALLLPETLAPENRRPFEWRRANALGAFAPLRQAGGAAPLILTALVWQLAHMVYPSAWTFWAKIRFGWSEGQIGWSLAASGAVMIVTQALITQRAIKLLGEARAMLIGIAAGTLAFAAYAFIPGPGLVYAVILLGFAQWFVFPSTNALLSRLVDARNQGALQGGMASVGSVAAIAGPLMMSQALALGAERGFPGAAFALAAVLGVAALVIVARFVLPRIAPAVAPTN